MDKISNSKDEESGAFHNAETFVLDKLFHKSSSEYSFVSVRELMKSIDKTMYLLVDQAMEELITQSLIHSKDRENYQITPDGISKLTSRKSEAIPL